MDIRQENRPLCKCHNISMIKDGITRWCCPIKRKARKIRYNQKHPDRARLSTKKYDNSLKGYITKRKYKLNKMREENIQRLAKLQKENPWLMN